MIALRATRVLADLHPALLLASPGLAALAPPHGGTPRRQPARRHLRCLALSHQPDRALSDEPGWRRSPRRPRLALRRSPPATCATEPRPRPTPWPMPCAHCASSRPMSPYFAALCDLAGVWPVMTVTRSLGRPTRPWSAAVRFLFCQAAKGGDWLSGAPDGYIVLGMGKFGACELNYSSDIDLVVFYDRPASACATGPRAALPRAPDARLVRLLTSARATATSSASICDCGPIPAPCRSRPPRGRAQLLRELRPELGARRLHQGAAGGRRPRAGSAFLDELSPFVWRKYLDSRPSPTSTR